MGSNPSKFKGNPTCPVEMVNWDEASAFCRKLGELPQEQAAHAAYRLPTEAEWEYACRAGTTTTWYSGDDEVGLKDTRVVYCQCKDGKTHPVRQKTPNAWGLYDMHGNAWEWCQDWYGNYDGAAVADPGGPSKGLVDRVYRGGGCVNGPAHCRSANRNGLPPRSRSYDLGFRLVSVLAGTPGK